MWKEGEGHTSHWLYPCWEENGGRVALCRAVRCRLNGRAVTQPPVLTEEYNLRPAREPTCPPACVAPQPLLLSTNPCSADIWTTSAHPALPRSCGTVKQHSALWRSQATPHLPACPWGASQVQAAVLPFRRRCQVKMQHSPGWLGRGLSLSIYALCTAK